MPVSEQEFRDALARFASGVSVVTTKDAHGNLHGITVSAFCSVSLAPPVVLICIEKATASHSAFKESSAFVVNILNDTQRHLSERFAAPADDKFSDVSYRPGIEGIPVLDHTLANLECRLKHSFEGGDHSIYVGEVERTAINTGSPLLYFSHQYKTIGK